MEKKNCMNSLSLQIHTSCLDWVAALVVESSWEGHIGTR